MRNGRDDTTRSALRFPRINHRYRLLEDVALGADGRRVFRAESSAHDIVALKVQPLDRYIQKRERQLGYFRDEVAAGTALVDDSIVRLLDSGIVEDGARWNFSHGFAYLVFEWMQSGTLADLLASRPLRLFVSVILAGRLCNAVSQAHAKGIRHRDVKPSNVFLAAPDLHSAKLGDFGIARATDGTQWTTTQGWVGSWQYMAPEQFRGSSDIPLAADQYSLALLLWRCIGGEVPYDCGDHNLTWKARERAKRLSTIRRPAVSLENVSRVLRRALSVDPAKRWGQVTDFREALARAFESDGVWPHVQNRDIESDISGRTHLEDTFVFREAYGSVPHDRPFDFHSFISANGVEIQDNRDRGGALWLLGDEGITPVIQVLRWRGYHFRYFPAGTRQYHWGPSWQLLDW